MGEMCVLCKTWKERISNIRKFGVFPENSRGEIKTFYVLTTLFLWILIFLGVTLAFGE
jgi:hypothetical protein